LRERVSACISFFADQDAIQILAGPDQRDDKSHYAAVCYLTEHEVFNWLVGSNIKGVAPQGSLVMEAYMSLWPDDSKGALFHNWLTRLCENKYGEQYWLRAFRRKWAIHYQKLPKQSPLSVAEIALRARSSESTFERAFEH